MRVAIDVIKERAKSIWMLVHGNEGSMYAVDVTYA